MPFVLCGSFQLHPDLPSCCRRLAAQIPPSRARPSQECKTTRYLVEPADRPGARAACANQMEPSMYDHIGLHVGNLDASIRFYAALLAPLGYVLGPKDDSYAGIGPKDAPGLWLYPNQG